MDPITTLLIILGVHMNILFIIKVIVFVLIKWLYRSFGGSSQILLIIRIKNYDQILSTYFLCNLYILTRFSFAYVQRSQTHICIVVYMCPIKMSNQIKHV